jgi:hypothetical protein
LCGKCYRRVNPQRQITCKECGNSKPHQAHRLCETCYQRGRYRARSGANNNHL